MPESKIFYENIVGIKKIVCKLEETEPLNAPNVVVIFRIFCYNEGRKYRTERSFYYVKTNHHHKPNVWK